MGSFPELLRFRAGLMDDAYKFPGLLQHLQTQPEGAPQPQPMPQPQGQPQGAPAPSGGGGGFGEAMGNIFGGQDDPRLTPEQNAEARKQAMLQAGLAILASPESGIKAIAQGGMYGQQFGAQAREVTYGRTQQERMAQALQDPAVMEMLPPEIRAIAPYMNPDDLIKTITESAKGRFLNTGFNGNVYDTVKQEFVQPSGSMNPDAWTQGSGTVLNPATNKQEHYAFDKNDPTKIQFFGEAQGPAPRLVTDVNGRRVPDIEGVTVPLPGAGGGGGGGFGAGGIPAAGRTVSAINSLAIAHENMKAYETSVLAGKAKFDGIDQFKARLAGHFDKNGVVDDVIFSTALADMGKNNPALATYLQNEYLWALEDAMLSNRPSDFRTKLDTFVSAMKANPTQGTLNSIWEGREARLRGYQTILPALQARLDEITGSQPGAPPAAAVNPFMNP